MSEYEWHVVAEPVSKPGVAKPTAVMTAVTQDFTDACYWASDLVEIAKWELSKVTITRVVVSADLKGN